MATKKNSRVRSKTKIRKKIFGTSDRPRLTVFRSLKYMYVQMIDDVTGNTLVAASSLSPEIREAIKSVKGASDRAKMVGKLAAEKAAAKSITMVVFDRNGYQYHGNVKAVAEGAREGGLKF